MMNRTSQKYVVRISLIYKRHSCYSDYIDSVRDDAKSGNLVTYTTSADVIALTSKVNSVRRLTVAVLCENLDNIYDTVKQINHRKTQNKYIM